MHRTDSPHARERNRSHGFHYQLKSERGNHLLVRR
ncbi:MAG: 50S ribosomal protein L34 [Desulfuromonadales bacterium]